MFLAYAVWTCIFNAILIIPTAGRLSRIIDGDRISIEDAPYQISIYNSYTENNYCGGSIVSREHVLTAGHCINFFKQFFLTVRSGSTYWARNYTEHRIVNFWRHEGFNSVFLANDIAIIKVTPPFKMSAKTKIISLSNKDEKVQAGKKGFVTGWGHYRRNSTNSSQRLRGLNVTVIDKNNCVQMYRKRNKFVKDHEFCASTPGVTRDVCNGDSGGPLVIDRKLAGIVSWSGGGKNCALPNQPGVYVAVSDYRDWIDKRLKL